MRRRSLGFVAVALLMLLAADAVFWLVGTRILAGRTEAWIAAQQRHGWTIATGERSAAGWPFHAKLVLPHASISGGDHVMPGGLNWSADRVILKVGLFHPFTLAIDAEGQQFLRLSHAPDVAFTAARETVRLPLLGGTQSHATLEADGLSGGIEGSGHPQDVQLARLSLRMRQVPPIAAGGQEDGWLLDIRAAGLGLPDIGYWPLGATVNLVGAELLLTSPRILAAIGQAPPPDGRAAAEATAWRNGGGSLSVRDANLIWGPLAVRGRADLTLDAALQPSGKGSVDVAGTGRALDAAARARLISPGVATTASAVLAVMNHVTLSEEGRDDADAVRLPFRLHDSTLSVGAVPVAQLPSIGWGRAKPS